MAAIDESVPTPVLSAALYGRFSSRDNDEFANKVLSAMRAGFGGHVENRPRNPEGERLHSPFRQSRHSEIERGVSFRRGGDVDLS